MFFYTIKVMNARHVAVSMAFLGIALPCFANAEIVASSSTTDILTATSTPAVLSSPVASSASSSASSTEPVILQMADGRFYHPASGMVSPTREDLLQRLGLGSAATASSTNSVHTASLVPEKPRIVEAAERARLVLLGVSSSAATSTKITKTKTATNKTESPKITLAIWDPVTDTIATTTIPFAKKDLSFLAYERPLSNLLDVATIKRLNAGDASDARKVVGIRFPFVTSFTKKALAKPDYVVYTPYSATLKSPEVILYGRYLFDQMMEQARSGLRDQGVRSRIFPDRLLADVVDPNIAKAILLIEHSDRAALDQNSQAALDPFFITIAFNGNRAFGYAKSKAGASGIAQFMPKTYAMVVKNASAVLIKDPVAGSRDVVNAMKAELVYLDQVLNDLPASTTQAFIQDSAAIGMYVAAAYNGGTARVAKAANVWGEEWAASRAEARAKARKEKTQHAANISLLKKKIKKETSSAALKKLKARLAKEQSALAKATAEEKRLSSSTLFAETRDYVLKYRRVIALLTGELSVILAYADDE